MLIRNIDAPRLYNDTRLIVKKLMQHVIQATVLTGCTKGEDIFIPRIPIIPSDNCIQFNRIQFPLKLCFAMTIDKSQGQSLGIAGIDLADTMLFSWAVDIALKFCIPPNSFSTIIKKKRYKLQNYDSANSCSKRLRTCVYEDVYEAVLKCLHTMRDKAAPISRPFVMEKTLQFAKALEYDQVLGNNGWLEKFKKTDGKIRLKRFLVHRKYVRRIMK
ncbi:tigger transposable element-derived protein 4 [Trichonephila clavipes]|nr:tigger transposable element-derived protein 4 [Trichonephila clavipes]